MKYSPYSASKLSLFGECAKKFYFRYIEKIKIDEPEKVYFEKGHFFHHVLRYYPDTPPKKFRFNVSSGTDVVNYENTLTEVLKSDRIVKLTGMESVRERYFKIFENWEADGQGALFQGYIDYFNVNRKEGTAEIIDWKSGKYYPDKSDDQLKLYAIWLFLFDEEKCNGEINTITCSYYYIEHGKESKHTFFKKDLQNLIQYFDDLINTIENEVEFPKSTNQWCNNCPFFEICAPFSINIGEFKRWQKNGL